MRDFTSLNITSNDWINIFSKYAISKEDIDNLFKIIRNIDIFEGIPQEIDRNQITAINRKVLTRKVLAKKRIILRKKITKRRFI